MVLDVGSGNNKLQNVIPLIQESMLKFNMLSVTVDQQVYLQEMGNALTICNLILCNGNAT